MNRSDSERIDSLMRSSGFKPALQDRANILILNLCSVRQSAIDRAWGKIHQFKKNPKVNSGSRFAKRHRDNQKIILTGCILPADKKKFQNKVDLILDIKNLPNWPEILNQQFNNETVKQWNNETKINYLRIPPTRQTSFSAYVPIMTGCNNFCSYCAVPYTRGREQSRPVKDIIQEVYTLIIRGYKLIILLGQNVNSYKDAVKNGFKIKNFHPAGDPPSTNLNYSRENLAEKFKIQKNTVNFPTLLKMIDRIPGNYWLSFITSHPKDMSDELIKCFKTCKHLIPYLHLPMQSGSDKILKAMNRKYAAADYLKLIQKIRRVNRDISISTDVIVGFPGETKKDFQATAKLMKKIKFDMAYIAQYSPRPGTTAAKLKDDVSAIEKASRRTALNEILKKTALKNNQKLIGQTTEALVESTEDNFAFGRTKMMKNVKIKIESKNQNLIGQFVDVKIIKATAWNLEGELARVFPSPLAPLPLYGRGVGVRV
ncbi:hypothetical protein A3B87_03280 [Candidatus Kuenenbacteria bacterium RIFCSPHIGHO2_02_FULL_39_13]|uniref:tRNA-2-methylthio-N(6)-dimethylallyladenosine synthase n=1 Tax=Candidatus Kuenenbacteria bacterium RIFCSPHIGHO2_02_FULL_39_13 TaxID=1798561 RepID=A0A1F6FL81_9BACT|nr:MAG: hypothetical protein A3B87_03280 [Candidatus Kuenenbacteria bacterium RIFCSPHIGHO2_02_FULL_39_13]